MTAEIRGAVVSGDFVLNVDTSPVVNGFPPRSLI